MTEICPKTDSPLILIETDQEIIVAWADNPSDWIARFKKEEGFPAHHWATRMQTLYSEQNRSAPQPLNFL